MFSETSMIGYEEARQLACLRPISFEIVVCNHTFLCRSSSWLVPQLTSIQRGKLPAIAA